MKTIAIVNQKGGSGKSSTAALTIKALHDINKSVIAIDADPQGGLTTLLLGRHVAIKRGLYDYLSNAPFEDCRTVANLATGALDILPGDHRLDMIAWTISPHSLRDELRPLRYDFAVIDCPPSMVGIARAAIHAAHIVIVPCEISETALAPTQYSVSAIKKERKTPRVALVGYKDPDGKGGYKADLSRDFKDAFQQHIAGTIPRNVSAARMAADPKRRWTNASRESLQKVILQIMGVEK